MADLVYLKRLALKTQIHGSNPDTTALTSRAAMNQAKTPTFVWKSPRRPVGTITAQRSEPDHFREKRGGFDPQVNQMQHRVAINERNHPTLSISQ